MNTQDITTTNAAEANAARALANRDMFDSHMFGTKIRTSVALYILALITLLSFFILPFTGDTITTRSQNNNEIGNYRSEVSDMLWNENGSTGFQVAMGRTVHYTRVDKQETTVRLPLTNGIITGKNTKDMNLYISYGNILIAIVPILTIYVAIMVASREQWQKGKGYLVCSVISLVALVFNFYMIRKLATGYTSYKPSSKVLSNRLADIFSHLGAGFYVSVVCLALIVVISFAGYLALRKDKGYVKK